MKNPFGVDAPFPRFDMPYQYIGGEDIFAPAAPYFKPAAPNPLESVAPQNALTEIDYANPTPQTITRLPYKYTTAHPSR